MATRSATTIWLIGQPLPVIEEFSQLPLSSITLRRIFFEMKTKKATLPAACSTVADEVMSFWARANIPTIEKSHVVSKLKALHQQYVRVAKNKHRKSAAQQKLETQLTMHLSLLFDVAHADWQKLTKVLADIQFLVDQRGPRKMAMSTEDTYFRRVTEKRHKRKHQRLAAESEEPCTSTQPNWTDSTVSDSESSITDDIYIPTVDTLKTSQLQDSSEPPSKRCVIEDPVFNAALDRTKTRLQGSLQNCPCLEGLSMTLQSAPSSWQQISMKF